MSEEKLTISSDWTIQERMSLVSAIARAINEIDKEETETRKRIHWDAPCFREWADKKRNLLELLKFLESETSKFLETNRQNFEQFIEV